MFLTILIKMIMLCIFIGIGYFSKKANLISENSSSDISAILVNFTVPCLIIMSMQQEFSNELLYNIGITFVTGFAIHIAFLVFGLVLLKLFKNKISLSVKEGQIFLFVVIFSNMAFMGFPVIKGIYGEIGMFYASIINISFNLLVYSLGVAIVSSGSDPGTGTGAKINIKKIINPGVIASIIGILFFVFSVKIPDSIGEFLAITGNSTTPLSMIVIGTLLAKADFRTVFTDKRLYFISFLRLFVLPLLVFLVLRIFIKDILVLGVFVLVSGMPAASMTAILAQRYNSDQVFASKVVFVSTVLSIFTIPLISIFVLNFL